MGQLRLKEAANQLDALASSLRREAVRSLRLQGKTFTQISTELGISRARAHELWEQAQLEDARNGNGNGKRRKG